MVMIDLITMNITMQIKLMTKHYICECLRFMFLNNCKQFVLVVKLIDWYLPLRLALQFLKIDYVIQYTYFQ